MRFEEFLRGFCGKTNFANPHADADISKSIPTITKNPIPVTPTHNLDDEMRKNAEFMDFGNLSEFEEI